MTSSDQPPRTGAEAMRPRTKPAELYEEFYGPGIFLPLARDLVPFARPRPGARALDLACGTGIVARTLAPHLGSQGAVVGIDINPAMIDVARAQGAPKGAPIEWRTGDAVQLEHEGQAFDLAICQQGLQFFADRAAALERVRGLLVPGGRLAVAVWQDVSRQTLLAEFAEVEARHLEPLGVTFDAIVAPFSLGDEHELATLLEETGYEQVEVVPHPFVADLPSPETFARTMETAYAAVVPAFIEHPAAFEAYLDRVERETVEIVERYTMDDRVRFPMPAIFARAVAG